MANRNDDFLKKHPQRSKSQLLSSCFFVCDLSVSLINDRMDITYQLGLAIKILLTLVNVRKVKN